jgi:hypothetical protein
MFEYQRGGDPLLSSPEHTHYRSDGVLPRGCEEALVKFKIQIHCGLLIDKGNNIMKRYNTQL